MGSPEPEAAPGDEGPFQRKWSFEETPGEEPSPLTPEWSDAGQGSRRSRETPGSRLTQCHGFPPTHEDRAAPRAPRGPLPHTPRLHPASSQGPACSLVTRAHAPLPTSARRQLVRAAGWASGSGTRVSVVRAQDFVIPLVLTQSPPTSAAITGCSEGKALALVKGLCANPPGFSPALLSRPARGVARTWRGSHLSCVGSLPQCQQRQGLP